MQAETLSPDYSVTLATPLVLSFYSDFCSSGKKKRNGENLLTDRLERVVANRFAHDGGSNVTAHATRLREIKSTVLV